MFTVFMDQKPLTYTLGKIADPWSARQQRHLAYISEFKTNIRHIAGKPNVVADALSCPVIRPVSALDHGIDYCELAAEQRADAGMTYRSAGSGLAEVPCGAESTVVLCDVSTGRGCPIVPVSWRRRVFDTVHGLAHPCIHAMSALLSAKFVLAWAPQAGSCLGPRLSPLSDLQGPAVHAALVQDFAVTHLFTIVDRFMRWPEVIPLTDTSAVACTQAMAVH